MGDSLYDLLGVERNSTPEEIKKAYFRLVKEYHPDANHSRVAREIFLSIQHAYEVLNDPNRRMEYDRYLQVSDQDTSLVDIHSILSQQVIAPLDSPQLFYVLLELSARQSSSTNLIPDSNICVVLDRSTSMKGQRIEMVTSQLEEYFKKIPKNQTISLVAFNDKAEIILTPTKMGRLEHVQNRLRSIIPGGGTEIYKGLKAGLDLLWLGESQCPNRQLILITDGHTYGDEERSFDLASRAYKSGITINALGIGNEWNDQFLEKLAALTGGSSYFISSSEDLEKTLSMIAGMNISLIARNVVLEYTGFSKSSIQYAYRIHPYIAPIDSGSSIRLGELERDKKSIFLIAFKIEPLDSINGSIELMRGYISFDTSTSPVQKRRLEYKIRVKIGEKLLSEKPPTAILSAISRITLYNMQERARTKVNSGEISEAVRQLDSLSTQVKLLGYEELSELINHEADCIKKEKSYSLDGEKRIKYGTRALLSLPASITREP